MKTVRDTDPNKIIAAIAEELKKKDEIKPPASAAYTKSGVCAERPPTQPDFWYLRSAAIMRRLYLRSPVGVSKFRTAFGGKKRRGHKPAHHRKAGGKYIRTMLQQLEKAGFITKTELPKKGRILTPTGQKLLDNLSKAI